jgi:hypothetical protein
MKLSTWAIRGLAVGLLMLGLVGIVACDSESAYERPNGISVSTTSDEALRGGSEPVYQRFNRVREGMTYDEVVRIMGGIPPDSTGLVTGTYTWEDSGGVAHISFEGGRVASKVWMGWP